MNFNSIGTIFLIIFILLALFLAVSTLIVIFKVEKDEKYADEIYEQYIKQSPDEIDKATFIYLLQHQIKTVVFVTILICILALMLCINSLSC